MDGKKNRRLVSGSAGRRESSLGERGCPCQHVPGPGPAPLTPDKGQPGALAQNEMSPVPLSPWLCCHKGKGLCVLQAAWRLGLRADGILNVLGQSETIRGHPQGHHQGLVGHTPQAAQPGAGRDAVGTFMVKTRGGVLSLPRCTEGTAATEEQQRLLKTPNPSLPLSPPCSQRPWTATGSLGQPRRGTRM